MWVGVYGGGDIVRQFVTGTLQVKGCTDYDRENILKK